MDDRELAGQFQLINRKLDILFEINGYKYNNETHDIEEIPEDEEEDNEQQEKTTLTQKQTK